MDWWWPVVANIIMADAANGKSCCLALRLREIAGSAQICGRIASGATGTQLKVCDNDRVGCV
eukprot:1021970-Pleurochrysis_carterae.AAC.1